MPKRLIGVFPGEAIPARVMEMRQGLEPVLKTDSAPGYSTSNAAACFALSPDQSYAVCSMGVNNTSGNIAVYSDPVNMGGRSVPGASWSGTPNCCAASNTHYAFGGTTPILYVYEKSSGSLLSVSTTGLGTISGIDFSPDGSKMAVVHSTSPYVRVYNTTDWTYVNAGTAPGSSCYSCIFSHDSTKLITLSAGSPYICVFNPSTGSRDYSNTTATYKVRNSSTNGPKSVRSPLDSNTIIYLLDATPFVAKFDFSTNTPSGFTAPSPAIGAGSSLWVDPDSAEDAVYVHHDTGSTSPTRTLSKFKISTGEIYSDQPAAMYRNVLFGSTSANSSAAIIMTTPYQITGTVRDVDNDPAARKVRAYRRSDGLLVAETTSNGTTGDYTLKLYEAGPFDVQFQIATGELLNDLFFARSVPEAVT